MRKSFKFEYYFEKAISEWPERVDCTEIEIYSGGRFVIKNLGVLEEDISKKYINHSDELIMREIHKYIYVAIHDAARYLTLVCMDNLRSSFIKNKISESLIYVLETGVGNWDSDEDKAFISSYLAENN